ncbi:hypothetical protein DPMN_034064 [Dreissena polymorpha]|uniref:Uncharacterized protein n=1 Tax=Dreissena polymorpha TaxID=45954 RepID=A0A9D4M6X0_DREPO|nr:hypothetical protein DPMN_034064 [Dreissena polymorpha]
MAYATTLSFPSCSWYKTAPKPVPQESVCSLNGYVKSAYARRWLSLPSGGVVSAVTNLSNAVCSFSSHTNGGFLVLVGVFLPFFLVLEPTRRSLSGLAIQA